MSVQVSIITPCYNHGKFLDEMISSVESTIKSTRYELIIVNDGSTDEFTITKLKALEEQGYYIIHQPNQGLGTARNNAIAVAKGAYIVPLDADNKLNNGFIDKCVAILDTKPGYDVVYTDCFHFGERGKFYNTVGEFDLLRMINMNYIDACSMYRKNAWQRCGGYDVAMPAMGHEDWELWLNMSFSGSQFYYIPEPLYFYRVSDTSMNSTVTMPRAQKNVEYILEKHKDQVIKYYRPLYEKYKKYD